MENPTLALVVLAARASKSSRSIETLNAHGRRAQALHGGMEQRAAGQGHADVPVGQGGPARRDRRRRPRARHRKSFARVPTTTLPVSAGGLRPPGSAARAAASRAGTAITLSRAARASPVVRTIEGVHGSRRSTSPPCRPWPTCARSMLDVTKASIRERILAGELDDVRVVVQSLAQEFDIVDIAAAAVKLAHAADETEESEREIPTVTPPSPSRSGSRYAPSSPASPGRPAPAVVWSGPRSGRRRRAVVHRRGARGRHPSG